MSENEKETYQGNQEKKNQQDFSKKTNNHKDNGNKQGNKNSSTKNHKPRTFEADKNKSSSKQNNKPKENGKKEKKPDYQYQVDKLLKVPQKEFDEQLLKFFDFIKQDSLDNLKAVVNYMGTLYSVENEKEREKNRKKINSVLLNSNFKSYISNLKNRTSDVYTILKMFDDKFDLHLYSDLTLNLNTIFYGSYVKTDDDGYKVNPPENTKSIYRLIEIILDNDKDLASKWISEVFNFDKTKLCNKKFEDIVNPDSDEFKKILMDNPKAHQVFIEMIFSKRPFQTVTELKNKLKETESDLNRKVSDLEDAKRRLEYDLTTKVDKVKKLESDILSLNNQISTLNTEKNTAINDCTTWKSKFDHLNSTHKTNMEIAERIQNEYDKLKIDSATKEKADEDYINQLEDQKEKLEKDLEALKADMALKTHKLSEMASEKASSRTEARSTTMKNLVQKVSSPFYYLSMFCQEFNETQSLSEESSPFFVDTVNQIESAFALMGAKKVGKLDEIVKYDTSIHEPMGGNLANGDACKITEPGWKIEDEVFIKAKVEKVEDK